MLLSRLEHHHRQRDHHRPISRQSGLVPLTLLLKPRLPPHTTHHTGCGRHSTTANVGMPLAPLCLPSNPLSSRQLKVPQGASTGATTPCERHGSMAAVEPLVVRIGTEQCNARNATHYAVHTALRAPHSSSTGGSWCLVISQQALSGDEQFNICSDNGHCI